MGRFTVYFVCVYAIICQEISAKKLFGVHVLMKPNSKGKCDDKFYNCRCGTTPGYLIPVPVKQCVPPSETNCTPCNALAAREFCNKFKQCLECNSDAKKCSLCPPGRYGDWCLNECACMNGGICASNGDCNCQPNFGGSKCEILESNTLPLTCIGNRINSNNKKAGEVETEVLAGTALTFTCPPGTMAQGETRIECTERGTWSFQFPSCKAIDRSAGTCSGMKLVQRTDWGPPFSPQNAPIAAPAKRVIFHHTVTPECTNSATCSRRVQNIHSFHTGENGWDDIGYNFLIGGDGNVYEGRGWGIEGAHTRRHNKDSVGIAFIGDFTSKNPSEIMLTAATDLLSCGIGQGYLASDYGLYGQRDGVCSAGPGTYFYNTLQSWPHWHQQGQMIKNC